MKAVVKPDRPTRTPGLNGVMATRGRVLSDRWDDAWNTHAAKHRKDLPAAAWSGSHPPWLGHGGDGCHGRLFGAHCPGVLVGYLHQGSFHARIPWIGRLNEDCTPDATFGPAESGVVVLGTRSFASSPEAENAWLSAVVIEPVTNRIFVGGTITAFDPSRGFFAGRMFVAALLPDGSVDATFGTMGGQGGVVMSSEGWHDELHGLAYLASGATGDEARLILAGESYRDEARTTRRVRMVSFLMDGSLDESAYPLNTPASGVVDAWATDVAVTSGREVFVSVVYRSDGT